MKTAKPFATLELDMEETMSLLRALKDALIKCNYFINVNYCSDEFDHHRYEIKSILNKLNVDKNYSSKSLFTSTNLMHKYFDEEVQKFMGSTELGELYLQIAGTHVTRIYEVDINIGKRRWVENFRNDKHWSTIKFKITTVGYPQFVIPENMIDVVDRKTYCSYEPNRIPLYVSYHMGESPVIDGKPYHTIFNNTLVAFICINVFKGWVNLLYIAFVSNGVSHIVKRFFNDDLHPKVEGVKYSMLTPPHPRPTCYRTEIQPVSSPKNSQI